MRDEQWEIVRKHFPAGRPQVRSSRTYQCHLLLSASRKLPVARVPRMTCFANRPTEPSTASACY